MIATRKLAEVELNKRQLELEAIEDKAVAMLPRILMVNERVNLVRRDRKLGVEAVENYLEAVVSMNADMKVLAANAYQLQDIVDQVMEENEILGEWMRMLELDTLEAEKAVSKVSGDIDASAAEIFREFTDLDSRKYDFD